MKHADVRSWMLTASPAELGAPPEVVGAHVSGCSACAGALAVLTRALAVVGTERDAAGPRMSEGDAVRLALAGARGDVSPRRGETPPSARRRPASRRTWTLVPAAVLAAVAVALLWPDAGPPPPAPVRFAEEPGPAALAVRVEVDDRVAVFATPNPRIHVVWMIDETTPNESGR